MIDLSFLTEEEQEAIMKVLQRDAELKRNEEERVRHLPEKIKNDNQLKNMSGQWFYEAKSKRHRDKIHGADIIRASIRRKSTTMAEQSQNKSDKTKNSWVNNVNKEVSVPAELSGIREETEEGEVKSNQSSNALVATLNKPQESSKKVAVSPGKQRKNPFNDFIAPEQDVKSSDSESGTTGLSQMPNADTLSPSKESQSKRNILNNRSEEHRQASGEQTDESQRIADQPPVPKARKVIYRITDPILEKDDSFPKPAKRTDRVSGAGTPPRGILKRSSSSSSTDSEGLRVNQIFDHQGKTGLPSSTVLERVVETNPPAEDPSQHSLERLKQVRFSSRTGTKQPLQSPQLQCGKDIGEFDLLESDYVKNAENDTSMLDALQNEQTLPVKSPRSQSSALDVNATDRDASQEDTSAPYSSDANRSSLPVNETLRLKTSLPMEPVIPRKSSSNISPNVQEVQIVDETLSQNISKQFPNPDLESSKHTIDQQPLSAKTKSTQVPNASTADLQGKPVLVENQSAKTTSKPDKHAAEFMKAADESISKVLDWFKRSSNTDDENTPSVTSQGRESKEELYLSSRARVTTTKDSGPSTDENTRPIDLSFGNNGKPNNVLKPAAVDAEDIQILKVGKKENQSQEIQGTDYNKGPIVLGKSKTGREKIHLQVTDLPVTKLDETNILKKLAAEGKMLYKPEDESAAYKQPTFLKDGKGKPGSKSFSPPEKLNEGSLLKTNVQTGIQKEEEKICTIKSLLEEDHVQSQTGFDDRGIERKEPGLLDQGSMQLDPSSSRTKLLTLPQHESKQPSQVQISDEETEQKRRVRDIRAFWEKDKTGPRHTNKEDILSTTPSASSTAQYINKGSSTVKPTDSAASLSSESKVQNKHSLVTVRRVELSDDEASKDKFLTSSKTGPDIMEKSKANHNVEKSRKILQSDGKVNEFTKLLKANHLQPRIGFTPASSNKYEDRKQVSPENDRNPSSTQQKPNFKILSLKEKIDEMSKDQISNPLQFQSLRSFWDIGAKSHMENETTSPGNISSATYQKESKELKESRAEMSQEEVMVQQQNQLPWRERTKKINFKVPESPRQEGQPIPWSVNLTRTENSESVQIVGKNVGKSVISKPKEKVDLPEQEVKEYIEKRIVPPKVQHGTFNNGLQKLLKEMSEAPLPSFQTDGDKGVPGKELGMDEQLIVSLKTMQSKTAPTDSKEKTESPNEEVAEIVDKTVAPSKAELDAFNAGLEKLLKETSQISSFSSQNVTESTSEETVSWPGQRRFFEKVMERSHNTYPRYQKEEALPQEVKETIEKTVIPPKDELDELKIGLGKLLKESDTSCPFHQAADADEGIQRESSHAEAIPSSSQKAMHPGITAYVMIQNEAQPPGEAVSETVEKTTVPPKTEFCDLDAGLKKLLKEASKISFSSYNIDNSKKAAPENVPEEDQQRFYKQVTETDQATSVTAQERVGTPNEIGTVERTTVAYQDNVSPINTRLEKRNEEAAKVLLPLHAKSGENVSSQPEDQTDHPASPGNHHEVTEILVKTVQPKPELHEFNASLQKLLKEASEMPPSDQKSFDNEMHIRIQPNQSVNCTYQQYIDHPQEVKETVEKAVAPSKSELGEFNSGLEKLLKEVSEMQTPKLKSMDNAMQKSMGIQSNQSVDLTYQQDTDHPQEVNETIAKAVAPSKSELGDFNASLQKLLKEASETPPLKLKSLDSVIQGRTQPNPSAYSPFQQEMDHAQEIKETLEKTVAPTKAECSELNICLKKLLKEASDVSSQLPTRMGKQERPNDAVSQAEKGSLAIKMPLSGPSASSSYRTEFKMPIKRETLKQNDKAVKEDHVVNEVRGSALPERNVAFEKTVQTNLASTEALPKERENGVAVIKTHKMEMINENKREEAAGKEVDKSISLADDGEATSEVDAPSRFRRASTPLKDDDHSSKISKVELLLASPYDDDEDDTISFGSDLSGSTCSEEELDPILKALKRSADRQRPSKSLEDIPSATSNKGKVDIPKEELVLSAEDVSTVPSDPNNQFSNPEKLKRLSKSVPAFLQEESDERDTDTTSESSYRHGRIKKSPSSLTNLSGSSGMASLSSVSGSVMSIYSGDFGNVDVKGHIQFAIDYVEQLKELHIFVSQCKDLAIADVKKQHSDPYVKTYLLPEKYKLGKRKTSVKKKTLNPVYNEILRYKIDKALVKTQRLNLSVWHNDTFGRNSFLGEVELDLGTWDWNDKQNKQMNWFPLKPRTPAAALELENRGEIKLALQYVPQPVGGNKTPSTGEVHIWVKECNDLPLLRGNKLNSFVKCTILPDTSRKSRQKTRAVEKTTNPVFNHTMVYDGFRTDDLKEACVELTVWDHHKLANHFLGGLRIGMGTGKSYGTAVDWMDSTLDETTLWERMMSSPNKWVEDTLPLRMLMVAKLTK
ncbi:synaptotagmin-like protein 2 isoform X2 [Dermochelys coriacea]|uniref:synaptotagmin-like protein 2 isoform X2 n=1 Tax=Dermochelys coriacea TaxID=27794 RepID=UPI0018E8DECF|nr:synaptotagmin-like protein 2 isoform X2 [Dermochelys coriacea]XP_038251981.1 synaptotagmin-like protein 2 isoform X2 [Dermochelys coriacea]XP_038251990.1 synaptotagmin-like protein 2 isoform X2 [Dermochelys coriacea]